MAEYGECDEFCHCPGCDEDNKKRFSSLPVPTFPFESTGPVNVSPAASKRRVFMYKNGRPELIRAVDTFDPFKNR
ncbi:MAG: hypothetical protein AAB388_04310 [Patescibacteria group bacterium]